MIINLSKDPIADIKEFTIKHFYINDLQLSAEEYAQELFKVTQMVHHITCNKNMNVFVYSSTGISRAPTVMLTYLCLFKKVPCWYNLDRAQDHLDKYHPVSHPNLHVIQKCLDMYKEFQD